MKFAKVYSAQNHLLKAHLITIEIDLSQGLHSFSVVGLPDKAVEESRDRVSAAIKNSGFKSPKQTNTKIVVSLAPADIKKEGPLFDLPIALGYLLASGEIDFDTEGKMFAGELALDGAVRPIRGVLSYARLAKERGFKEIYVPKENANEAALIGDITVFGVEKLSEIIAHLCDNKLCDDKQKLFPVQNISFEKIIKESKYSMNLDDIVGQETAKRGLVIAAAGGHNIALYGPPGTGKTMLARALSSILPPLTFEEMLEVTEIHSVAGCLEEMIISRPPVRSPHHTASYVSLVGGGNIPRPGEITLAHRGVLFLDEFPEFDERVIESLRQPMEDRVISISRANGRAKFPAHFILVAALNPCPCGNRNIKDKQCTCSMREIGAYERKLSGPIMDRIDMWIEVSKVDYENLLRGRVGESETDRARERVVAARARMRERFDKLKIKANLNSAIDHRDLARAALLSEKAQQTLNRGAKTHDLSGRGYHRVIKLARTIADIEQSEKIEESHILEALQYRQKHFKNN
ncbi:MAG: YifB family Mg chelatase-like AAA ATPase [bacterium]|nr:YifB family Mg chelatase-like AAA ATPase [bacterium]